MSKLEISIHTPHSLRSLFHRSRLFVSNKTVETFDRYLGGFERQLIYQTRIDSLAWRSGIILPEHIIEGIPVEAYEPFSNRAPAIEYAYRLYLQFVRQRQLSFSDEISNSLFSGCYQHHYYRITPNAFPYHTHPKIEHLIAWINPNYFFPEQKIEEIKCEIQQYVDYKGYRCFLFENTKGKRSIEDVRHIQIFLQT